MENTQQQEVTILMVPFPAQSHLNQLLQFSCLISNSYNLPVHFIASAIHNRQAKTRTNGLDASKVHFHDLPIPPFVSPPPNPNSSNNFPSHLQPSWDATMSQRKPFAKLLHKTSLNSTRVIVIHDINMAYVVQDVATVHNAESYAFNVFSAFYLASFLAESKGINNRLDTEDMFNIPSSEDCLSKEYLHYESLQYKARRHRSGNIYNTCRLIESPYLDILTSEDIVKKRKSWAIGPILHAPTYKPVFHTCMTWLDKQASKSVIYVAFGTTVSLSDEQIKELALGLERSKVKFIWSLRDADKGDVFDGVVRKPRLPQGFEDKIERVGMGMVVRDWAPQPDILAHGSVGGFMSPCGWSSCVESFSVGVPIAAWPMLGDQPSTAVLITDVLKVGLVAREWSKRREIVNAENVENVVRRLMVSEEGDRVRKRAEDLSVVVRRANEPGGTSRLEMDSFVAHITRPIDDLVSKI